MIPKNLKVGDTFTEGNSTYEVMEVIPGGYRSKRIKLNAESYAYEEAMKATLELKKEEVKEEVKEETPAPASETKYTKTEINRLNNAELEKLCKKLDIEPSTGMAMKKALIEKLGL